MHFSWIAEFGGSEIVLLLSVERIQYVFFKTEGTCRERWASCSGEIEVWRREFAESRATSGCRSTNMMIHELGKWRSVLSAQKSVGLTNALMWVLRVSQVLGQPYLIDKHIQGI